MGKEIENKKIMTIIVPIYNVEQYLEQCINSITSQICDNFEIILVDDGSIDSSGQIADKFGTDDRIRIIHKVNEGPFKARLDGLKIAEGKYVTFVDADDFILLGAYDKAFKYMEQNVDEILYEITRYYNNKYIKRVKTILRYGEYNKCQIIEEVYPKLLWDFGRNAPGIECSQCVRIVKTELIKKAYNFNKETKNLYYGEDMAITYPLTTMIETLVVIPESYYMHRQRVGGNIPPYIKEESYFINVLKLHNYLKSVLDKDKTGYDFSKQLDYLTIYSFELRKVLYSDYRYHRDFLFPFDKVETGKTVVLYGAGDMGKIYYGQLNRINYCRQIIWIDKNADGLDDTRIYGLSKLQTREALRADYVVIAIENIDVVKNVKQMLLDIGYKIENIVTSV